MILFRLLCVEGPDKGKAFDITEEGATIGREGGLGVALEDDSVSREHAEIRVSEEGVEVVDLGSSNGTLLNGRSISRDPLRIGDRIQLGDTVLAAEESESRATGQETRRISSVEVDRQAETHAEDPLRDPPTDVLAHGSEAMRALAEEADRVDREYGRSGVVMKPGAIKVTCMDGPDRGRLCTPHSRRAILGTDPAADICLSTPGAAFHHAELIPAHGKKFILKDLGSREGTFVEGKRVEQVVLKLGSVFQIGRSRFIVHI